MMDLAREYTIVVVTHNMQQAARVSSYATFMLAGSRAWGGSSSSTRRATFPETRETREPRIIWPDLARCLRAMKRSWSSGRAQLGTLPRCWPAALCEDGIRLCAPEPSQMLPPLAVQMLRELDLDIRLVMVMRVGDVEQRYGEIIFIAKEGLAADSRIDLPRGRLCESRVHRLHPR